MSKATTLTIVGVAAILLVIGIALGSISFPQTRTETTIQSLATTVIRNDSTVTVVNARNFNQETISKVIISWSYTAGGQAFCEGNLSTTNGCLGSGIVQISFSNSTSYIFPSGSSDIFLNATLTTVTSTGIAECEGTTTSTTTVNYNSTSGYGRIDYSWSQSCSVELITTTQNNP